MEGFIKFYLPIIAIIVTALYYFYISRLTRKLKMLEIIQKEELRFDCDFGKRLRFNASNKLLKYLEMPNEADLEKNYELDELLELFASLAIYYKHHAIKLNLIYDFYNYYIIGYWIAGGKEYVYKVSRKDDKRSLMNLEILFNDLHAIRKKYKDNPLDNEYIITFLKEEIRRTEYSVSK